MRVTIICTWMLAFVLAVCAQPVTSAVTGIPFAVTDNVLFMKPVSTTALTIEQYNSSSLFGSHASHCAISFPQFSDGSTFGPTMGTGTSSNVLPFGQVSLAFPSMSQRTDDELTYEQSYFFTDTF